VNALGLGVDQEHAVDVEGQAVLEELSSGVAEVSDPRRQAAGLHLGD